MCKEAGDGEKDQTRPLGLKSSRTSAIVTEAPRRRGMSTGPMWAQALEPPVAAAPAHTRPEEGHPGGPP